MTSSACRGASARRARPSARAPRSSCGGHSDRRSRPGKRNDAAGHRCGPRRQPGRARGRPLPDVPLAARAPADRLGAGGRSRLRDHLGAVRRGRQQRRGLRAGQGHLQHGLRRPQRDQPARRRAPRDAQRAQRAVPAAGGQRLQGQPSARGRGRAHRRDPGPRPGRGVQRDPRTDQPAHGRRRPGLHRRRRRDVVALVQAVRRLPGRLRPQRNRCGAGASGQGRGHRLPRRTGSRA